MNANRSHHCLSSEEQLQAFLLDLGAADAWPAVRGYLRAAVEAETDRCIQVLRGECLDPDCGSVKPGYCICDDLEAAIRKRGEKNE